MSELEGEGKRFESSGRTEELAREQKELNAELEELMAANRMPAEFYDAKTVNRVNIITTRLEQIKKDIAN